MQDTGSPPRISRLAGSRRGRRIATSAGIPDVSRRLATLERQVEAALGLSMHAAEPVLPLEAVIDGVLTTANRLRRAVAGEPEAAAELIETPLDLLYRWWWRVEVVGLERLPRRGPVLVVANR